MEDIVKKLTKLKKTISTMESCTGGGVANYITNIEGASAVFNFSAVTYSNDFKIKMGVSSDIIDMYSVYSMETAIDMSKAIANFSNSNYGIGITGKLNRFDKENPYGKDNIVYVCIYDRDSDECNTFSLEVYKKSRKDNKQIVIDEIINKLKTII